MQSRASVRPRAQAPTLVAVLVAGLLASCASIQLERTTQTSGTFRSTATAFTFLSYDFPASALETARANAADTRRPNLIVEHELVVPYFWRLDWLLDIIGFRYARVTGTWGTPTSPDEEAEEPN